MIYLRFIWLTILSLALATSCQQSSTVEITEQPVQEMLEVQKLALLPVAASIPDSTLVYFLIDNSLIKTSASSGCGELGKESINYVDFVTTNILKSSIPEQLSKHFLLGIGSFDKDFYSIQSPINIGVFPNDWRSKITPAIPHTKYVNGMGNALDEMYDTKGIQNRRLIVVTDGYFTNDSNVRVKTWLEQEILDRSDSNLSFYIALICDRHLKEWKQFNSISRVKADTLENITAVLFEDLNDFFPIGSQLVLPTINQVTVPRHSTSVSFLFWSTDIEGNLTILGNNGFNKTLRTRDVENDYGFLPINGCPPFVYNLDSKPTSNWFLFVKPQPIPALEMTIKTSEGDLTELVNNSDINIEIEINPVTANMDLVNIKDCFSAHLVWETSDQVNQVNRGEIDLKPCPSMQSLCFEKMQWRPLISDAGIINLKIILETTNENIATIWESTLVPLPTKFKAELEFFPTHIDIASEPNLVKKEFLSKYTTSHSQADIYLVSSTGKLDNDKCPKPTHTINGLKARLLDAVHECNLEDVPYGNRVCISRESRKQPLEQIYVLYIFERLIEEDCQYNQLYFDWLRDKHTKETTWLCDISQQTPPCVEVIPRPVIVPIQ